MAAKSGKAVILKVMVPNSSPPSFVLVGGARNHNIDQNPGLVDASDKDSGGWTSVGPFGLKSTNVTLTGVYKGSQGELIVINHIADVMTGADQSPPVTPTPLTVQLIEDGVGTWQGNAYVRRTIDAPHDNILGQTLTFESDGAWAFTPESPQS